MNAVIISAILFATLACADLALMAEMKHRRTRLAKAQRMARAVTAAVRLLTPGRQPIPFRVYPSNSSSVSSMATCSSSSAANSLHRSFSRPSGSPAANLWKWSRVRRSISSAA